VRLVVPPEPGELLVSVDGELAWPAQVDLTDRWNGWLSPRFRPSVARVLAAHVQDSQGDDSERDQLVLSPDGRTLAHLVWDEDAFTRDVRTVVGWPIRWLSTREHAVWLVYDLDDPTGHVAVGAWHWCWFQVQPSDLT
jgi:hypothetical protein